MQIYPPGYGDLSGKPHLGTDYLVNNVPLRAPFDGLVERHDGPEGGIVIHFFPDGTDDIIRFLHLSQVGKLGHVLAGELIAITGATGQAGVPHLHLDISPKPFTLIASRFKNPELYNFMSIIPVTVIGEIGPGFAQSFDAQVQKWSKGNLALDIEYIPHIIGGSLTQDESYVLANQLCPEERYVVFVCTPQASPYKTFTTADNHASIVIGGADPLTLSYELSHALVQQYNAHRGTNPYIQIDDTYGNVTNEQRYHKYEVIMPYVGLILGPYADPIMFELRQVAGQNDVWLVKDGKRTIIDGPTALLAFASFADIKQISQSDLNAIPFNTVTIDGKQIGIGLSATLND